MSLLETTSFAENFYEGRSSGYVLVLPTYQAGIYTSWAIPIQKYTNNSACIVVHEDRDSAEKELNTISSHLQMRTDFVSYQDIQNYCRLMNEKEGWIIEILLKGKDGKLTQIKTNP